MPILTDLPEEIIDCICQGFHAHPQFTRVGNSRNLLNLARTCRAFSGPALKALYAAIKITATAEALLPLGETILSRPDVAAQVRWLALVNTTDVNHDKPDYDEIIAERYPRLQEVLSDMTAFIGVSWAHDAGSIAALIAFTCSNLWRIDIVAGKACNHLLRYLLESQLPANSQRDVLYLPPTVEDRSEDGSEVKLASTYLSHLSDINVQGGVNFNGPASRPLRPGSLALQAITIWTSSAVLSSICNLMDGSPGLRILNFQANYVALEGDKDFSIFYQSLLRHAETLEYLRLIMGYANESNDPAANAWDFTPFARLEFLRVSQPLLFGSDFPAILSQFDEESDIFRDNFDASLLQLPPLETWEKYANTLINRLPERLLYFETSICSRMGARALASACCLLFGKRSRVQVRIKGTSACLLPELVPMLIMARLVGGVHVDIHFSDGKSKEARLWWSFAMQELENETPRPDSDWLLPKAWEV